MCRAKKNSMVKRAKVGGNKLSGENKTNSKTREISRKTTRVTRAHTDYVSSLPEFSLPPRIMSQSWHIKSNLIHCALSVITKVSVCTLTVYLRDTANEWCEHTKVVRSTFFYHWMRALHNRLSPTNSTHTERERIDVTKIYSAKLLDGKVLRQKAIVDFNVSVQEETKDDSINQNRFRGIFEPFAHSLEYNTSSVLIWITVDSGRDAGKCHTSKFVLNQGVQCRGVATCE